MCSKRQYTKEEADMALKIIEIRKLIPLHHYEKRHEQRYYQCPWCDGAYHLTSQPLRKGNTNE